MAEIDELILEKGRWVHISFAPARRHDVRTAFERVETSAQTYYIQGIVPLDGSRLVQSPQASTN